MKTIYILLTRSGTLLSKLVYAATGASYTHASMAFDAELSCLYSSTRKNGYTMFPAGPSKEYLNKGVFRLRDDAPCALYALEVSDEAYFHALHRAEEFMRHSEEYSFNTLGADLVRAAYPLAAPPALFLLPVRQRGAGTKRCTGAAQVQHPDAPQRLRPAAPAEVPVQGALSRPAPAQSDGAGRDTLHGQHLYRPAGGAAAAPGAKSF